MDITPIYELRTRLKTAIIAGTNLLSEDFRLKRAVEAIQPLLAASPVFAKIGQLMQVLLTPGQEGKEGLLLDAISLVDAVICTQGVVTVSKEIEPIKVGNYGVAVTNAPYSVVRSLIDALTSAGNGRYSYVIETHKNHPELFDDYRIKMTMVEALDANYAELANQVAEWMEEDGENVVPLLKGGFDPKGKKVMVRRVQVIDKVSGAKENDFYLEKLADAEKEVRQALIYALRHSMDNIDQLLEMAKTEKGGNKKAVYYALAEMEDKRVSEFFWKMMDKKPEDVVTYIELSETDWASEITAKGMMDLLLQISESESKVLAKAQAEMIKLYWKALPHKHGESVMECYRLAASVGSHLSKPLEGETEVWKLRLGDSRGNKLTFRRVMARVLDRAVYLHPTKELCDLARELYENVRNTKEEGDYFLPAVTARLFTEEDCSGWLREQMGRGTVVSDKRRSMVISLEEGLSNMCWDNKEKSNMLYRWMENPIDGRNHSIARKVKQKISGEFAKIMMELESSKIDDILSNCIAPEDTEYRDTLMEYYYNRALSVSDNRHYCYMLKNLGGTKCEGLAVHYFRSRNVIDRWEIAWYVDQMPGTAKAKAVEIGTVIELIQNGKLKGRNITKEWIDQYLESMKYQ